MGTPNQEVVKLIKQIIGLLVDDPDGIEFDVTEAKSMLIVEVRAGSQIGQIVGKGGHLAAAIRELLKAIGTKEKVRYEFSVSDED